MKTPICGCTGLPIIQERSDRSPMPLTTLLLDLDGTLLPLDLDAFLHGYFAALLPQLARFGDVQALTRAISQATEATIRNEDATTTNFAVFQAEFCRLTQLQGEAIWRAFDAFYATTFSSLQHLTQPNDIAREICRTADTKGYRLALATNPIFPERAIRARMAWAGIDSVPFALVTAMEDMHFCKPNPKYFIEIMDKLGVYPEECIMFGNDVQEDGVAGLVGMETYLVTDCLVDRKLGDLQFTHSGRLVDALRFVQQLPALR